MRGSTSPGGTSKRNRARLRSKNSAAPFAAGSVFTSGSIKARPSFAPRSPLGRIRRLIRFRTCVTIDHSLLADVNQIIIDRPRQLGPEIGANMEIGHQTIGGPRFKAQTVAAVATHPIIDIGAETQQRTPIIALLPHFDRQKRRVVDADADLFHRRDKKMLTVSRLRMVENSRHQCWPPDRRAHIEPGAVGRDPDVESPQNGGFHKWTGGSAFSAELVFEAALDAALEASWRQPSARRDLVRPSALASPLFALS